jgi:hypothetical protein
VFTTTGAGAGVAAAGGAVTTGAGAGAGALATRVACGARCALRPAGSNPAQLAKAAQTATAAKRPNIACSLELEPLT